MKNPYIGVTLIVCFFSIQSVFSQPVCGFDATHGKALNADTAYRNTFRLNEARIQTIIQEQQARRAMAPANGRMSNAHAVLYTIPVVVHVVHTGGAVGSSYNPSNAQITGAINYLNQVYNGTYPGTEGVGDIQIQFALARFDTNCNTTNGIDRLDGSAIPGYFANGVNAATTSGATELDLKNSSRWDPYNYYNIWVVHKIDGADGTVIGQPFIAGYARFAGGSPALDGTVMLASQMGAGYKTLPHEIGHALNLHHPFQGSTNASTCPANTSCSTEGDYVCDTDPITYNETAGVFDFSCRTGTNPCTGTNYNINTEHNFMNYTTCYTLFTADQKTRMLAAMSFSGRREYAGSWALSGTYPISYSVPVGNCTPVTSATGLSNHFAGIMEVAVSNKLFPSSTALFDNGYVNRTTSCLNLINLQENGTYTLSTTLWCAFYEQVNAWIDYNNNGTFETSERIFQREDIPEGDLRTESTSFTVPGTAVKGVVLRMRVTDEVDNRYGYTITDGCYNPTYGQAEDYAVLISPSTLPVTMQYFKGEQLGSANRLLWKTSSEINTNMFEVERSYNGTDYSRIGTVEATGAPSGFTYSYDDNAYTGSIVYYRLKQVDLNGDHTYSNIVMLKSAGITDASVTVLNNPFHSQFDCSLYTPVQTKAVINLLDATGKLVYTSTADISGNTVLTVSPAAKSLSAGLYIVQVQLNGKMFTKKVIKN